MKSCRICGKDISHRRQDAIYCEECYKKDPTARERQKRWRMKLRKLIYTKLCGDKIRCMHCGMDDLRVLQIDHINAGGSEDRRKHGGYFKMLKYIANLPAEEARKTYQVLCANCNIIKRFEKKEAGESAWE